MLQTLENDLISLSLKRVFLSQTLEEESIPNMTMILDSFCRQKKESIISLKRQMSNLDDVTEAYAKRFRVNNT